MKILVGLSLLCIISLGLVDSFILSPIRLERHEGKQYVVQSSADATTEPASEVASAPSPVRVPHNKQQQQLSRTKQQCRWYTCSSSNELAQAIPYLVRPEDVVVEIGAQLRVITQTIVDVLSSSNNNNNNDTNGVLCMDVQRHFPTDVDSTRTRVMRTTTTTSSSPLRPEVDTFCEMACLDDWRSIVQARPFFAHNTTVLVLDINSIVGNDLDWTSFALLKEFTQMVPTCRAVLVKSKLLNQWSHRILHAEHWIQGGSHGRRSLGPTQRSSSTAVVRSPKIIATVGVKQYRRTIPRTVQPGDTVLEVGCHCGTTTQLLYEAAGSALGVDIGPRIVQAAQQRYPEGPTFAVGDAWKTAQLLRLQAEAAAAAAEEKGTALPTERRRSYGFDVIYVDIGGLSGENGLMEALVLLNSLQNALEPRCIVIKSACVQQLSTSLVPFQQTLKQRNR